jgi:sugar (pentulose or hexulose) kinase
MTLLGFDCGSSSVKAAVLKDGRPVGKLVHGFYKTSFDGIRAEVDANAVLRGLKQAIDQLGPAARRVDHIAMDAMSPSWVAMDAKGKPLTPIITHQDRRSVAVAHALEDRVGKARHLKLAGNRPVPGGISSTTWAWYAEHEPAVLKQADLVGHLTTFLLRTLTGARVTDPSNASFMGVYETVTLKGWSDELCEAVGADKRLLPDMMDGNRIAGTITPAAARRFGLTAGTPVLAGVVDTSATLLLRGATVGEVMNVCGSTDVLAVCTDKPRPDAELLTRAVGVGRKWVHVGTLAAAGSALQWVRRELFAGMGEKPFYKLCRKLAKTSGQSAVKFDPYLAGSRTGLEQRTASFTGLSLATTRDQMLAAVVEALAVSSAARLPLLQSRGTPLKHDVLLSGGLASDLSAVLHRDWPSHFSFTTVSEATLRGLAHLDPVD